MTTTDRDGPRSNPYHLNPDKACEACVFGTGEHSDWCEAEKLSEHFSRSEFACRCCGRLLVAPTLLSALEHLRAMAGKPLIVTSGYRCEKHNAEVGGKPNSFHTRGMAADVRCSGFSADALYRLAVRVPGLHGFGIDQERNFLHVDIRAGLAQWSYRGGKVVPFHEVLRAA